MGLLVRARPTAASASCARTWEVDFAPGSFDAVVALYSLAHLPRADQPAMLQRACRWLRPGGLLLATLSADDLDDEVDPDWLGAGPMRFAGHAPPGNRRALADAGFVVEIDELREQREPGSVASPPMVDGQVRAPVDQLRVEITEHRRRYHPGSDAVITDASGSDLRAAGARVSVEVSIRRPAG